MPPAPYLHWCRRPAISFRNADEPIQLRHTASGAETSHHRSRLVRRRIEDGIVMKSVIKALLAASMLMPIAAQAQEQDGRERGRGGRGGEWGQRGDRPERSAEVGIEGQIRTERPQRAEFRAERQQPAPDIPQDARRPDRTERADRGTRDWNSRDDDRRDGRQTRDQRNDGQRGDGRWNRDADRGDRQRAGNDPRQQSGSWSQPDRRDLQPGIRDGRQAYRQPAYGQYGQNDGRNRGEWRGNAGRNWNEGRGYDNRGYNGGGAAWNRGWRNDNRYDWSRNRQLNRGAYNLPRYYAPSGWGQGYRRFSVGVSLSSILFNQNYWIDDPYTYRLPEAYGPYRWVRYYDDALLVDIRSGQVIDTVYDIFY